MKGLALVVLAACVGVGCENLIEPEVEVPVEENAPVAEVQCTFLVHDEGRAPRIQCGKDVQCRSTGELATGTSIECGDSFACSATRAEEGIAGLDCGGVLAQASVGELADFLPLGSTIVQDYTIQDELDEAYLSPISTATGWIRVGAESKLTSLELTNLVETSFLEIKNDYLADIDLPSLHEAGTLQLQGVRIETLSLPAKHIGEIYLNNLPVLTEFRFPNLTRIARGLTLTNLPGLQSYFVPELTYIGLGVTATKIPIETFALPVTYAGAIAIFESAVTFVELPEVRYLDGLVIAPQLSEIDSEDPTGSLQLIHLPKVEEIPYGIVVASGSFEKLVAPELRNTDSIFVNSNSAKEISLPTLQELNYLALLNRGSSWFNEAGSEDSRLNLPSLESIDTIQANRLSEMAMPNLETINNLHVGYTPASAMYFDSLTQAGDIWVWHGGSGTLHFPKLVSVTSEDKIVLNIPLFGYFPINGITLMQSGMDGISFPSLMTAHTLTIYRTSAKAITFPVFGGDLDDFVVADNWNLCESDVMALLNQFSSIEVTHTGNSGC